MRDLHGFVDGPDGSGLGCVDNGGDEDHQRARESAEPRKQFKDGMGFHGAGLSVEEFKAMT